MSILSRFYEFGKLELVEVYEFYDKPLLFSSRNAASHLFLFLLIDDDDEKEKWLCVSVSKRRLEHIRSGAIDLHDAFANCEERTALIIDLPTSETAYNLIRVNVSELAEDQLPVHGEFLLLKTDTLARMQDSLQTKARETNREFVRLRLVYPNALRTEAPIKQLGEIFQSLQDLVNSIGQSMTEKNAQRGVIPHDIVANHELAFVTAGSGSFEIELAALQLSGLFGDSDTGRALQEFLNLLIIGDNEQLLQEKLMQLKPRAASKYLLFLRSIKEIAETDVEWASPRPDWGEKTTITKNIAQEAIRIIERSEIQSEEIFTVFGYLIGANLDKRTYEFWAKDDRSHFSGKITGDALDSVRGAALGGSYYATIHKISSLKSITGEPDEKNELTKLSDS